MVKLYNMSVSSAKNGFVRHCSIASHFRSMAHFIASESVLRQSFLLFNYSFLQFIPISNIFQLRRNLKKHIQNHQNTKHKYQQKQHQKTSLLPKPQDLAARLLWDRAWSLWRLPKCCKRPNAPRSGSSWWASGSANEDAVRSDDYFDEVKKWRSFQKLKVFTIGFSFFFLLWV